MTTFLRFPDEARAQACMSSWYDQELGWVAPQPGAAVDVLGTLYTAGEYNAAGNELVAPAPLPGWHLNVVGDISVEAAIYIVQPRRPRRVFA